MQKARRVRAGLWDRAGVLAKGDGDVGAALEGIEGSIGDRSCAVCAHRYLVSPSNSMLVIETGRPGISAFATFGHRSMDTRGLA